jgi:hypothetical protein
MIRHKALKLVAALLCGSLSLCDWRASADDKKVDKDKPALSGTWTQPAGDLKIAFSDTDVLKIFPHGDKVAIAIVCECKVEKGRVKAKVTELEAKDDVKEKLKEVVPVGLEFSFRWLPKGESATLEDIKGEKAEALKAHLEGKYELKK